ncbi:MAG: MerR family transcriptional regulator [Candidatus Eiseniibacteriota bacterium]|jgi:methanogenic corrinoid protein MtbC1
MSDPVPGRPTDDDAAPGDHEASLSIGELATRTGIAPDTLRIWERRYGRPVPVRLPSGHRRYTEAQLRWLRRIAEALARGHRPSKVVHLDDDALDRLLYPTADSPRYAAPVRRILEHGRAFGGAAVRSELQGVLAEIGPERFIKELVGPLLDSVGRGWADGDLEIRHEHFISEVLQDMLRGMRQSIGDAEEGPLIVLATLSGEGHGLGLLLVSIVCALHRVPVLNLGTQAPNQEVVASVQESGAAAVALSISIATGGVQTDRVVSELRRLLPDRIHLVVGGRGARDIRRGPRGVAYVDDLREFGDWLDVLVATWQAGRA